jgi:micrococcal nuclease
MKAVEVLFGIVTAIVDGDTIKVTVKDCAVNLLCVNQEVRFANFDTPELSHPQCAKEKELALQAKALVAEAYPIGSNIVLYSAKKDKYGRLLAEQPIIENKLLDAKLAKPYHGEKKDLMQWCK